MMNEWIISSSVLIAAVLLGRRLLRGRISLRLQYALWAVALVRLLIPFQIFTADFGAGSIANEVDLSEPVRQVYFAANEEQYERQYDATYHEALQRYESQDQPVDPVAVEREAADVATRSLELDLKRALLKLWLGGMAVMALVIVSCNVHLALRLKGRRWAMEVPESLLPVYITGVVPTPCVFGLFRPAIYLTPEAAKEEQLRAHVLAHELTHYRHGDHIWSVLRSLCLVLHWYNPLVWIAAKVSRADAELACDEGALERLGESQRFDYGRTLIGLTCSAPISELLLTATTMTGSAGSIRERIRLLTKRPRNTVLTVTAVVLLVTLIVGCTFAGAPETGGADETGPTETTAPPETTDPGMDNDMSYTGQELPIPEDHAALFDAEGLLIHPGFEWFMTEEEVLAKLGIKAEDCLYYEKTSGEGMTANSFTVKSTGVFGVPMELDFTFRSYWLDVEPVLTEVYADFENPADFESVRTLYTKTLGETDAKLTLGFEERWDGDVTFRDVLGREGYEVLNLCTDAGAALDRPASYIQWGLNEDGWIKWHTELPVRDTMLYRVLPLEVAVEAYADKNPRLLMEKEIERVNAAFAPTVYDEERDEYLATPVSAFFTSFYENVCDLNGEEFLRYFPASGEATEEEFQLLREKLGDRFLFSEYSSITQMPVPLHRYEAADIDRVTRKYANLPLQELRSLWYYDYYLEETDSYYNFTSDFGPGIFNCMGGFVYDGGAILYSQSAALYLREAGGYYSIFAHLPLNAE